MGNEFDFAQIFEEFFKKTNPDPRATGLIKTFGEEVQKGDKRYLNKVVLEQMEKVYQRTSNTKLLQAYAIAAIFVDNLEIGYKSLSKIETPNIKHSQAMGVIAYAKKEYEEAMKHFEDISDLSPTSAMIYSSCLLKQKDETIKTHKDRLESILEKSSPANTILGTLYFNSGNPEEAEPYFKRASKLSPKSESARLNLFRAQFQNGKQIKVYQQMNDFYVNTDSKLSEEELNNELQKKHLNLPHLEIKNLFEVINNLLT